MTPKEKAKELVEKFKPLAHKNFTMRNDGEMEKAKQCALICVMEQLEEHSCQTLNSERHAYWQSVKTEIEKL